MTDRDNYSAKTRISRTSGQDDQHKQALLGFQHLPPVLQRRRALPPTKSPHQAAGAAETELAGHLNGENSLPA